MIVAFLILVGVCVFIVIYEYLGSNRNYTVEWNNLFGEWFGTYRYFWFRRSAEKFIGRAVTNRNCVSQYRLIDTRTWFVLAEYERKEFNAPQKSSS